MKIKTINSDELKHLYDLLCIFEKIRNAKYGYEIVEILKKKEFIFNDEDNDKIVFEKPMLKFITEIRKKFKEILKENNILK